MDRVALWVLGILINLSACSNIELFTNNSVSAAPIAWTAPGLDRIGLTDQPGTSNRIDLYAARGEYEPFQIGIRSPQSTLTNINVSVSDLRGVNNHTISSSNITLYREHYVYVSRPSPTELMSANPSLGVGWYVDGLIPFVNPATQQDLTGAMLDAVPFNLETGKNQPIWVDVFVPRNTPAGQYTGMFTVVSDQGSTSGQITLNVWDFELPIKPSLNSSFNFGQEEPNQSSIAELLKHKLMPAVDTYPANKNELIDQLGLNSFRLSFWSGADYENLMLQPPPSVDQIKAEAAQYRSDTLRYVFSADEIGDYPQLYEPLKQWARNIHQAGVKHLVTIAPVPELYDDGSGTGQSAVDIWVILPSAYDAAPDRVAEVLQKGDQVWSYNALVQDDYSPKWQIDFAPINYRIQPGFINQSLGLTGLLYWQVDRWTNDPWNNVQTYLAGNTAYSGDGMLVYPGEQVGLPGVVPSMRLKWLREGVEDYEYIQILKNLGRGDWALQVGQQAGRDWRNWTRDGAVLESVRRKLGDEIQRVLSEQRSTSSSVTPPQNQIAPRSPNLSQTNFIASIALDELQGKRVRTEPVTFSSIESSPMSLPRSSPETSSYTRLRVYGGDKSP